MDPNKLTSVTERFLRFSNLQKGDANELKRQLQLYFRQPKDLYAAHVFVNHEIDAFHGEGKFDVLLAATDAGAGWTSMSDLQRDIWGNRYTALLGGDVCMLQSFVNDVDHWTKRANYERHVESSMAKAGTLASHAPCPKEAGATTVSSYGSSHSTIKNGPTVFGSHHALPYSNNTEPANFNTYRPLHSTSENGSMAQHPVPRQDNTGPSNFSSYGSSHKAGNAQLTTVTACNPLHRASHNESSKSSSPYVPQPAIKVEAQQPDASSGTFVTVPFASGTNAAQDSQLNQIPQLTNEVASRPMLPVQPQAHFWREPPNARERAYLDGTGVGFEAFNAACKAKFTSTKNSLEIQHNRGQYSARLRSKNKANGHKHRDITNHCLTIGNITYKLKSFEDAAPRIFFARTEAVHSAYVITAIAAVVGEKFVLEKSQDDTIFVARFTKNITSTGFEINVYTADVHQIRTIRFNPALTPYCKRCNLKHPREIGCIPTQLVPAPAWPVEEYVTSTQK